MMFRTRAIFGIVGATVIGYMLASGFSEILDNYIPMTGWVKVSIALLFVVFFGRRLLR